MSQAATLAIEKARDELARAIRSLREDCFPHETARQLLEYDQPGHTTLVGIDYEASKAVLYHEVDRYAIAVRFGPDGLADGGVEMADLRDGSTIETWVEEWKLYWGWVHPRYSDLNG